MAQGWLTGCGADRLNAAATAIHARRQADRNPGGLFVAMLRDHRWHLITQAEEDDTRAWLRDHDWGFWRRTAPLPSSLAPPPELSTVAIRWTSWLSKSGSGTGERFQKLRPCCG